MDGQALGTAVVIAMLLTPVVSLIKKPTWSFEAKYALGMVAALLAALGGAVVDGNVHSAQEFVGYFGTAFASAQTLYSLYFSKTDTNDKLENIGA